MRFAITHRTSYAYSSNVSESINEAYLCPISNEFQHRNSFELSIQPEGASILRRMDFFTNLVYHFELQAPHRSLEITAYSEVQTFPDSREFSVHSSPNGLAHLDRSEAFYDFLTSSERIQLVPMFVHEAKEIVGKMFDVQEAIRSIMAFIHREFAYKAGVTDANTGAVEAFSLRSGVCQDFAHVMIALCRVLGIPARYVSGYFYIERNETDGAVVDNSESHAWVDCYMPNIGWVGYDPTHNRRSDERYIRVAVGRDYTDVKPVSGAFYGTACMTMDVSVDVKLF